MKARLGMALAALLMALVFGATCVVAALLLPILIAHWCWRGLDSDENYIYRVGKAMDQVTNAALFAGHPKETVSSHAGRWIAAEREQRAVAPRWAHVIAWITGLAESDHVTRAIEEPFKNLPLDD